jgi:elongator complex protein 2
VVNAVKFLPASGESGQAISLISASSDKSLRLWLIETGFKWSYKCLQTLEEHAASINVITVLKEQSIFLSADSDGVVCIWQFEPLSKNARLKQKIKLSPHLIPLTAAIVTTGSSSSGLIFAIGGSRSDIQIYAADSVDAEFVYQTSLIGHDAWIRSLDFTRDGDDLLMASASQDKYIRLWRFQHRQQNETKKKSLLSKTLESKTYKVNFSGSIWTIGFEALLLGHEDWIFSAQWDPTGKLCLLSASADDTLAFWESDPESGIWLTTSRLGYLAATKGGTSATGSVGGQYVGLWSGDGKMVASVGRTGGWRLWAHEEGDFWKPLPAVTGHWREVNGIAWEPRGRYLLSASSDQTTRLWAETSGSTAWYEMGRPQIHGYDLNCITSLSQSQFVSGADEKLLRVFNEPVSTAKLLRNVCGIEIDDAKELLSTANVPVLGLSNKAVQSKKTSDDQQTQDLVSSEKEISLSIPPIEDDLARQTLWPETEKLYGHGYEISTVASSHDGSLVATACKASSVDHAVIRVYSAKGWGEIKPPLKAHSLTTTRVRFSPDDRYLVSVGRDRSVFIFKRDEASPDIYTLSLKKEKAHSRMILDVAWIEGSPLAIFLTAGRDKMIKAWRVSSTEIEPLLSIPSTGNDPVTAVDSIAVAGGNEALVAVGTENGSITIYRLKLEENPSESAEQDLTELIQINKR